MTTEVLIPFTEHGTPSGNYDGSSLDWRGDPVRASDYYGHNDIETVFYNLENFVGYIVIEVCHDQNPNYNSTWAVAGSYGSLDDPTPITDYHPQVTYGNFAWIRARVENFTAGTIKAVTLVFNGVILS